MKRFLIGGLLAALTFSAGAQHAAHEHGVAELEVAVDGSTLAVNLHGALEGFVGFEHAPRTPAQRAALDKALALLRDAKRVVAPPAAAGCKLAEASVSDPFAAGQPDEGAHDGDDHADAHDDHADLTASYRFECARPAALTGIDVLVLQAFPRLGQVRALAATPRGQRAVALRGGRATLAF